MKVQNIFLCKSYSLSVSKKKQKKIFLTTNFFFNYKELSLFVISSLSYLRLKLSIMDFYIFQNIVFAKVTFYWHLFNANLVLTMFSADFIWNITGILLTTTFRVTVKNPCKNLWEFTKYYGISFKQEVSSSKIHSICF